MSQAAVVQETYQRNAVLTAPPEQLVLMLYDGALRFLTKTSIAMREERAGVANTQLRRAEAILDELRLTLDHSAGEIAGQLEAIYVFCRGQLVDAQLGQDPELVDQVSGLVRELRDSWALICA